MIEFTKAAGSRLRISLRRFFYALFTGAYFTYTGILALAPDPQPPHHEKEECCRLAAPVPFQPSTAVCARAGSSTLILPYGSGPGLSYVYRRSVM
jgi:hypothetical protein